MDALARLASLLGPKAVAAEALLARDQPKNYAEKFAARMEDRELDEVDPWIALVDALEARHLACSIDWKFAAEDIVWNLERVAKAQKRNDLFGWYDEDAHVKTPTEKFIGFAGRAFSAYGLSLIELDIDSDSYELTLIERGRVAEAQKLAKAIGQKIVSWAPKTPLAKPLPPPKKQLPGPFVACKLKPELDFPERDARVKDAVVYTKRDATERFDFREWPPRRELVGKSWIKVIDGADGARILCGAHLPIVDGKVSSQPAGTLILESGKNKRELLGEIPTGFAPENAGFLGELVVLVPAEPTCRGAHRRPLLWDGKKMRAASKLPEAKPAAPRPRDQFPPFLSHGFARTGNGEDVLLWQGRGWTAKFENAFDLGKLRPTAHVGVPAPGDAFYLYSDVDRQLRRIERGKAPKVIWRPPYRVSTPVLGPDGALVFVVYRYGAPKKPILAVWRDGEVTEVPATRLGVRKDNTVDAVGVTGDRLWVVEANEARSCPWSTI